jgi:hypothetical protein
MRPLVSLDISEFAFRIADGIQLLSGLAPMSCAVGHGVDPGAKRCFFPPEQPEESVKGKTQARKWALL